MTAAKQKKMHILLLTIQLGKRFAGSSGCLASDFVTLLQVFFGHAQICRKCVLGSLLCCMHVLQSSRIPNCVSFLLG